MFALFEDAHFVIRKAAGSLRSPAVMKSWPSSRTLLPKVVSPTQL